MTFSVPADAVDHGSLVTVNRRRLRSATMHSAPTPGHAMQMSTGREILALPVSRSLSGHFVPHARAGARMTTV
jgi:hypothetical protein